MINKWFIPGKKRNAYFLAGNCYYALRVWSTNSFGKITYFFKTKIFSWITRHLANIKILKLL